ncbi:sensor histidine kinase [Actinoplanes sp. CA-030573]|uniref:sensor histidine kinase n=1 Tax=Actinoplanes sp. CA-030573 TaxID=3239898 RepID=UPI003D927FE7
MTRTFLAVAAALCVAVTAVWAAIGRGDFWPRWVYFGFATICFGTYAFRRALRVAATRRRWLAVDAAFCIVLATVDVTVYFLSGGGYFWPVWTITGLSALLGAHAWLAGRPPGRRERELAARVASLSRSRSGALDRQAAELKRIERDLHDGAQARMVSLALTLGLAGDLLRRELDPASTAPAPSVDPAAPASPAASAAAASVPAASAATASAAAVPAATVSAATVSAAAVSAAAKLVMEARETAVAALDDLRAVMHSIHPPVLADRGIEDAVRALALDLAVPVTVTGSFAAASPATETALYFAVAECLGNVVKHSSAAAATVTFLDRRIVITDDGLGGADPAGGSGLRGIADRLDAVDGRLKIDSPPGGPTRITITLA